MPSRASQEIIDQYADRATQRAIAGGKVDLTYASPLLRAIASEIVGRRPQKSGGGILAVFLGIGHSRDETEDDLNRLRAEALETEAQWAQLQREHEKWAAQHRSKNVPRSWSLLTDNGKVQSYSDGSGRIRYCDTNGRSLSAAEEHRELDRRYGSGD